MTEPPRTEDVRFQSAGHTLAGTFSVPEREGPRPAVLLLSGSGETDRDDNAKALAIDLFPQLSAAPVGRGLATLRYDKRGVGASEGDYWATGFDDHLTDAVAATGWLRQRTEVDGARIVALGHSEGALVSTRLAAGAAPVAGAILLAGSAKTGEEILTWQARQVAATLTGFNALVLRLLRIDVTRSQQKAFARIRGTGEDVVRVQGRRLTRAGCESSWPTTRRSTWLAFRCRSWPSPATGTFRPTPTIWRGCTTWCRGRSRRCGRRV